MLIYVYSTLIMDTILVRPTNPVNINNHGIQRDIQIREGEIKNLKMKIKQLEIQLGNAKKETVEACTTMNKIIDCRDTEIKFQVRGYVFTL